MVKIEKIQTEASGVSATHHLDGEITGLHPPAWTAGAGSVLTFNVCEY